MKIFQQPIFQLSVQCHRTVGSLIECIHGHHIHKDITNLLVGEVL